MTSEGNNLKRLREESAALFDEGRLEESAAVLERIISILEKPETADADQLIESLGQLGACYLAVQEYAKTVSVYSRLVVALDEKFGMDHLETIKAVYKLAKSCEKAGQREQAQTMYYVARESAQKTLPENNYLRQSIVESYQAISRPKRVIESVNTFVVGDLQDPRELLKVAKSLPQRLKRLSARGDIFLSIFCSLLLVVGSGAWLTCELERRKKEALSTVTAAVPEQVRDSRASTSSFATTDGVVRLRFFNDKEAEIECENQIIKLPVVKLSESIDSVLKINDVSSFGKRVWAETAKEGINTDGDFRLFSPDSMESKLSEACRYVSNALNEYYKKNSSYPDNRSDLIANGRLTYVNPYTGKAQAVTYQNFSQFMQVDYVFDGVKDMDHAAEFLRAGGRWNDEPAFLPGGINAVSRFSGEKHGEAFIVPSVFMHVADKDRQLVTGAQAGSVLVYQLNKGEFANDSVYRLKLRDLVLKNFQGKTLYVVAQGLFTNIWLWKNLTTVVLAVLLLAAASWWFIFDARARLKDPRKMPSPSELLLALSLLSFFLWIAVSLVLKI